MATNEFVCPRCRAELTWSDTAADCVKCRSTYDVFHGIPDFRLSVSREDKLAEWKKMASLFSVPATVSFAAVVRDVIAGEGLDTEVLSVELKYELEWGRRGMRALSRLHFLSTEFAAAAPDELHVRARVLDIGCGKGALLATLSPTAEHVTGIDFSVAHIGFSRLLLSEIGRSNFTLAVAEAEHLPFRSDAFDLVTVLDVVEHMAEQTTGAGEAFRVLMPGKHLFINSPNRFSLMAPEDHCRLWFVGFLPYRWQARYVGWRAGRSYKGVRLLSYWQLIKLLVHSGSRIREASVPLQSGPPRHYDSKIDALFRRWPALRWLLNAPPLKYVAPSHHALVQKLST